MMIKRRRKFAQAEQFLTDSSLKINVSFNLKSLICLFRDALPLKSYNSQFGAKKVQIEQYLNLKAESGSSVTADPPVRSTWSILENSSQFH